MATLQLNTVIVSGGAVIPTCIFSRVLQCYLPSFAAAYSISAGTWQWYKFPSLVCIIPYVCGVLSRATYVGETYKCHFFSWHAF